MNDEWDPASGISLKVHAISGSLAGAAEHGFIYPIDTIRTFLQAEGSQRGVIRRLVATEGIRRLWRGVSTVLPATIPAHAVYFSVFEKSKVAFGADHETDHTPLAAAACGALATVGHDVIMTPWDVVKQRLQLGMNKGIIDCAINLIRAEGVSALFRSYPTTLLMNIPFAASMVSANESFRKLLGATSDPSISICLFSGGLSGGLAGALTTPLDVIKTRLQTQSLFNELEAKGLSHSATSSGTTAPGSRPQPSLVSNGNNSISPSSKHRLGATDLFDSTRIKREGRISPVLLYSQPGASCSSGAGAVQMSSRGGSSVKYHGFLDTAQLIYQREGWTAFFRGVRPRIFLYAPSVAISWTTYETAKSFLCAGFPAL